MNGSCFGHSMTIGLGEERTIDVTVIFSWRREDLPEAVMSNSSGPKDYVKNDVFDAFQAMPEIERIVFCRGNGPLFAILKHRDGTWRDVSMVDGRRRPGRIVVGVTL